MRPRVRGQSRDDGRVAEETRVVARLDAGLLRSRIHREKSALRADVGAEKRRAEKKARMERESTRGEQVHGAIDDWRREADQSVFAHRQPRTARQSETARSVGKRRSDRDLRESARIEGSLLEGHPKNGARKFRSARNA